MISDRLIETVCGRITENKRVRRSLPVWGRFHVDRQLPFLCIYRRRENKDQSQAERLITGEASYLIASGDRNQFRQLSSLVRSAALTLKESFGAFLIVEIWILDEGDFNKAISPLTPVFKLFTPRRTEITSTIKKLEKNLKNITIRKEASQVEVVTAGRIAPPTLSQIVTQKEIKQYKINLLGIGVRANFMNPYTAEIFPLIRRELQRGFSKALKTSFFEFTNNHTPYRPSNYLSLGRLSMVKAVWEVDNQLARICNGFDFLLQVTPVNSRTAFLEFKRNHFVRKPEFEYRPLPFDPSLSKRELFKIPLEGIEDPTLAQLFREQQIELDRKFTMLYDRGTKRFMYGSLQLYGAVDESLRALAQELLEKLSPYSRDESGSESVNAEQFAERARQEIAFFRKSVDECRSQVYLRSDITGLMASEGNLLIGSNLKISRRRVEALIQHEVGTHILTYLNGKAQPFRQLYVGLAGYEELQEGMAVLSEYMVDGLTRPRLRLLAARVIAVDQITRGADFAEVFKSLNKVYGFEQTTAFTITMRTFRSGGLTKDAVYLRGLVQLLDHMKEGGNLEKLFVGKISLNHISMINELQHRKILRPSPLRPRYLDNPKIQSKLDDLRKGLKPLNLVIRRK